MENKEKLIGRAEAVLYHTYNRYPVVFESGKGMYLYDTDGNEYLDFGAGIAVMGLGYGDEEYSGAVKAQVDRLLHTSNLFYNRPAIEAGEKLLAVSGMDRVFFTNSGTEAVEGAIKIARRYAYNRRKERGEESGNAPEIVAMEHSFHGRSTGSLAVTGNAAYREPFAPLMPGVVFAEYNSLDSLKKAVTPDTCAILLETVQGEGGIYPADPDYLKAVRALCDENDILLILDEIQCGMGRTGEMFAWQNYGVKPDVMTVAKALGNGVPAGAFLACGKAAKVLVPGDHGTTYGGNPLVGAAAAAVLDIYEKREILSHVREMGGYLWETLEGLRARRSCVVDHRGMGLMQGLEFDRPVGPLVRAALLEEKLVLISAGKNTVRFLPPLIVERGEIDAMAERLERVLDKEM